MASDLERESGSDGSEAKKSFPSPLQRPHTALPCSCASYVHTCPSRGRTSQSRANTEPLALATRISRLHRHIRHVAFSPRLPKACLAAPRHLRLEGMRTLGDIDEVAVQLPDVEMVGGAVWLEVLGRCWKVLRHVEHRDITGWLHGMATAPTTAHGQDAA